MREWHFFSRQTCQRYTHTVRHTLLSRMGPSPKTIKSAIIGTNLANVSDSPPLRSFLVSPSPRLCSPCKPPCNPGFTNCPPNLSEIFRLSKLFPRTYHGLLNWSWSGVLKENLFHTENYCRIECAHFVLNRSLLCCSMNHRLFPSNTTPYMWPRWNHSPREMPIANSHSLFNPLDMYVIHCIAPRWKRPGPPFPG